jgi:cell division protein ZapA (FtsZ GTPase activity inhibitor)
MTQSTDELEKLLADATPLPWRQGQPDSRKVHPHWRDSDGNDRDDCLHKNGWAKTIATVGKEEGDWRDALRQHADAALIVAAVNALPELLAMAEENARLREALQAIADRHIPDQPPAYDVSEADYARKHYMELRMLARAALKERQNETA